MNKYDKLKAVRITLTYYGVGLTIEQAKADAWNDVYNDRDFQIAAKDVDPCDVEEANFSEEYLNTLIEGE
jgi:hypothetical protein